MGLFSLLLLLGWINDGDGNFVLLTIHAGLLHVHSISEMNAVFTLLPVFINYSIDHVNGLVCPVNRQS